MTLYTSELQEMCQPVEILLYCLCCHTYVLSSKQDCFLLYHLRATNIGKCENAEWDVLQTGSDLEFSSGRQNS